MLVIKVEESRDENANFCKQIAWHLNKIENSINMAHFP